MTKTLKTGRLVEIEGEKTIKGQKVYKIDGWLWIPASEFKDYKPKKEINLDLNKDGKVDEQDFTIAGKTLNKAKNAKKS